MHKYLVVGSVSKHDPMESKAQYRVTDIFYNGYIWTSDQILKLFQNFGLKNFSLTRQLRNVD